MCLTKQELMSLFITHWIFIVKHTSLMINIKEMEQHCYIISYDLCQPGRDYETLYQALKSFPNWGKLTESTWAVVTNKTAVEIRDFLRNYIDSNDRLIVILCGRSAAWTRLLADNAWVIENLKK